MDIAVASQTVARLIAAAGVAERAGAAERVKTVFGSDVRSADALGRAGRGEPEAVAELASALAWYAGRDKTFEDELAAWARQAGSANPAAPQCCAQREAKRSGGRETVNEVGVGLAANLITGLVVALALLLDHYYRISQNWLIGPWVKVSDLPSAIRWIFSPPLWVAFVAAMLAGGGIMWWQSRKEEPSLIWLGLALGLTLSTLLALIGYASGVK